MQMRVTFYSSSVGLGFSLQWVMGQGDPEKVEGKSSPSAEFYPLVSTDRTHENGKNMGIIAYAEIDDFVAQFVGEWNTNPIAVNANMYNIYLEKDLVKQIPMIF